MFLGTTENYRAGEMVLNRNLQHSLYPPPHLVVNAERSDAPHSGVFDFLQGTASGLRLEPLELVSRP
jgi:hypothetical protein